MKDQPFGKGVDHNCHYYKFYLEKGGFAKNIIEVVALTHGCAIGLWFVHNNMKWSSCARTSKSDGVGVFCVDK